MDVGSIFLILALVFVVGLFVSRPFFAARPKTADPTALSDGDEHRRSSLLAERDRLLTAIQELDFDHRLGKIPAEDYPSTRAGLLQNAALVLRRLDEFQESIERGSVEDRIEQAIAARRADAAAVKAASAPAAAPLAVAVAAREDDLEELIAARRRERDEKSAGFCPKCGRPVKKSDRFCSKCGTVI
jgi:hypothetical protein